MLLTRRLVLASAATLPLAAYAASPLITPRTLGKPGAKVHVVEYFSLTCTHCAEFQKETFPKIKKNLIDTGKVFYEWHDFPLDKVALLAAVIARALPPDQYEPFINVLLTTQDQWAFAHNVNSTEELAKIAALAGMPRSDFDKAAHDQAMQKAILAAQEEAAKKHGIDSTPTFLINGKKLVGAVDYPTFLKAVNAASA